MHRELLGQCGRHRPERHRHRCAQHHLHRRQPRQRGLGEQPTQQRVRENQVAQHRGHQHWTTADAIAEHAKQGRDQCQTSQPGHLREKGITQRYLQLRLCIGGHVDQHHVIHDGTGHDQAKAGHHAVLVLAPQLPQTDALHLLLAGGDKGFGLVQVAAYVESDRSDQQTKHKGQAPAPAVDLFRRETLGNQHARTCAGERRETLADHLQRSVEAALAGRRALDKKGCRTGELAARREALQQPSDNNQHWCRDTHSGIGGRKGDHGDG